MKGIRFCLFLILLSLATPLDGQTGRELRNPSPKELIAQLLLRRAQKIRPGLSSPTESPVTPSVDPVEVEGGGVGVGGGAGGGGGIGSVVEEVVQLQQQQQQQQQQEQQQHRQADVFSNFFVEQDEACTGASCGTNEEFKERWSMPLMRLGNKRYYLGIFFKANWYKALQYCRFHGMHLASIESLRENTRIENYIKEAGLGHEHFWTSGTDQGEEGSFFWMSNGQPVTYTNWNAGEPNNFQYENGEMEHCLELWNRDGKGLKWNDSPCSFETFFICEVQ
ncbi:mannose-binding protein-like isoform X2 [Scylla paramamosain]